MRILLTGASGLVGSSLARLAALSDHEVIGVVGQWSEHVPGTHGLLARDLAQPNEAATLVRGIRPDVIINAAALSEPSACDAAPELAQRMNVDFPAELSRAAAQAGIRLLHLSSEQAFDGEHAPYAPTHAPSPTTLYGRQKVASERAVLEACPRAAVVRIPLLLGNSLTGRRSVHEKLFELWAAGRIATLYPDEIRQVCSADSVAGALLALARRPALHGVFHWAGAEPISRWELGRKIVAHFQVRADLIVSTPRPAHRARDLSLQLAPLDRELGLVPERVDDAIAALRRPAWASTLAL